MHTDAIASDSTLADVTPTLTSPEEFVRRVLGNMHAFRSRGENVVVRLGITGTGRQPNYRLEDELNERGSIAYNGANHLPFPDDEQISSIKTWSTEVMKGQDVARLRAELNKR